MIFSGPSSLRASAYDMSLCPICTPSASTAKATSTLSFMMSGTPRGFSKLISLRPSSTNSPVAASFSRSCTMVTPPATASDTTSSRDRPSDSSRSVTKYSFNACFIYDKVHQGSLSASNHCHGIEQLPFLRQGSSLP